MPTISRAQKHERDLRVMPRACGAIGKRAKVFLFQTRALGIENAFHLQRLRVMRVRPRALNSLWRLDYRMLLITLIRGVS